MTSHALDLLYSTLSSPDFPATAATRIGVLEAEPHTGLRELAAHSSVECMQTWKPSVDSLSAKGLPLRKELSRELELVLFLGGKFRDLNLYLFAYGASKLADGGVLLCSMSNDLGAGRFEKHLRELFGRVESVSKHKCRAFWGVKSSGFNHSLMHEWLHLGGPSFIEGTSFTTVPGIFSAGEIDHASKLLAANLPSSLAGPGADLGGGWGYLSASVCERCAGDFTIDLVEADGRALDCARLNLAPYSQRVNLHWMDVLRDVPRRDYRWIVMNPPFHEGRENTPHLGQQFIEAASRSLAPGGELFMVANNHLPYRDAIEDTFARSTILAEERGFRVWRATK